MKKSYEMDMCSGPLLGKILLYSVPLMLSGILQLLFNAADVIVVGRFAGHESLAAVGSTSALINLLINVFIGLSRVCHFIRDESSRNIAFIGAFGGFNQNNATYLECLDLFL